jgi:hypothetical protein
MTMGALIPVIAEKPLAACGCKKFQIDALDDHLCTRTTYSGAKKADDWAVHQLADLFRTTHKVKTQQVAKAGVGIVGHRAGCIPCECGGPNVFGPALPHRPL